MLVLAIFVFLALAQIALGDTETALEMTLAAKELVAPDAWVQPGFLETLLDPAFLAKITPLVIGGQIILRGVADGLTKVSVALETRAGGKPGKLAKVAGWLSEAAWITGVLCGKFGMGTPKLVLEEAVDRAKVTTA